MSKRDQVRPPVEYLIAVEEWLMSKPKDPVIAVLAYFENAELLLVQQTLAIVQVIVKNRQHMEGPPRHPAVKKPAKKPAAVGADVQTALN